MEYPHWNQRFYGFAWNYTIDGTYKSVAHIIDEEVEYHKTMEAPIEASSLPGTLDGQTVDMIVEPSHSDPILEKNFKLSTIQVNALKSKDLEQKKKDLEQRNKDLERKKEDLEQKNKHLEQKVTDFANQISTSEVNAKT